LIPLSSDPPYLSSLPLHAALPSYPTRRSSDLVVQGAGELGKALHLPVLGQHQPEGPGGGLHGLGLGVAAHTGDREAHVHRRPLADRKSTRLNSSHVSISYAVFCL